MICYFAGNAGGVPWEAQAVTCGVRDRLLTYAELGLRGAHEFWVDGRWGGS